MSLKWESRILCYICPVLHSDSCSLFGYVSSRGQLRVLWWDTSPEKRRSLLFFLFQEPLNSADDVSEEDPTELFDAENVVVCQYDKVGMIIQSK